jgi:TldD protein
MRELADVALNAADADGAEYADIRISRHKVQSISAREDHVESVSDTESFGFGVRVLVDGTWGFAASHRVDAESVAEVTQRALAIARANRSVSRRPVRLAPVDAYVDEWRTPIEKDPFDVPLAEKTDLLLAVNAAALAVDGAKFCRSSLLFQNERKLFASTEGSYIDQDIFRTYPVFVVTATDDGEGRFENRRANTAPRGMGYEHVEQCDMVALAPKMAAEAVQKLHAPSVEPGPWDIILHPSNLWLTMHESLGHPTELDRVIGMEANYAGTSFLTTDKLGKFHYGSPVVNFKADRTIPGGLGTCGYDDDGVKTTHWHLIEDGVLVDYQTVRDQVFWPEYREARAAAGLSEVNCSYACSYADSWSSFPFQRQANIHLEPGREPLTPEELIADTERGIYIVGDGSFSIDQQRRNFQFGGQAFFEVRGGKIAGMLNDVAYQACTPDFWNACDAICDERSWEMGGTLCCGKGQPPQAAKMSHGAAPARFRQINILNTRRTV